MLCSLIFLFEFRVALRAVDFNFTDETALLRGAEGEDIAAAARAAFSDALSAGGGNVSLLRLIDVVGISFVVSLLEVVLVH